MEKEKSKGTDMLNGPLAGKIIMFALPILLTSVVQQLFNSADTAVIGRFGENGTLAAVGTNGEIAALIVSLSAGTAVLSSVIFGVILAALGELVSKSILALINTPEEIFSDALTYLRIYILSVPFLLIYNFGAAIFRSDGNSRTPLFILLVSGGINVVLNLIFVILLGMNVTGVAAATVISTALSAGAVLFLLVREKSYLRPVMPCLDKENVWEIVRIGLPAALQGAVFCFANIFVQAAVNSFGADAAAGSAVAMTFEYFAYYAITALGQAATTFISQNYAAHNYSRCKKTLAVCTLMSFIACAALTVPLTVFRYSASGLFTLSEGEIEMSCIRIMLILIELICTFYEIPASAMRGLGYSAVPAAETVIDTCLFRIVWIFTVFKAVGTLQSLYVVFPITWVVTSAAVLISYFIRRKVFAE